MYTKWYSLMQKKNGIDKTRRSMLENKRIIYNEEMRKRCRER